MKIIEKIEIKNFRSFLGTRQDNKAEILNVSDLNIFSGANDSGKSNILRALNLFFNNKISADDDFVFDRDFPLSKKDDYQKVIEIKIYFNLSADKNRDKFLPEKFSVSKFYSQGKNKYRDYLLEGENKKGEKIKIFTNSDKNKYSKSEKQYRQHLWGFINKISFEYVPAVKDKYFFSRLFGRTILEIKNNEDNLVDDLKVEKKKIEKYEDTILKIKNLISVRKLKIKKEKNKKKNKIWGKEIISYKEQIKSYKDKDWRDTEIDEIKNKISSASVLGTAINALQLGINTFSKELFQKISEFLPSEFQVGQDFESFFEKFDIGTGANKDISLKLRGDGIQVKFIPEVLNFLNNSQKNKKYFIWGFEEPENSSEYKNQQELAKKLKEKYLEKRQIFITTHSEEFLSVYDDDKDKMSRKANLYYVKKIINKKSEDFSLIKLFDVEKNVFAFGTEKSEIENDIGSSFIRANYSKELKKIKDNFVKEKESLDKENIKLQDAVGESNKPVLFVEDSYNEVYKIAWLKIFNKVHTKDNFRDIFDKNCYFSIFPLEGASNLSGFLRMQNIDFWKNKKVIGLFDFDEAGKKQFQSIKDKNCWDVDIEGIKKNGLYKKRKNHECFYAMLLPVPEDLDAFADMEFTSYIEIENLLPKKFLVENNFIKDKKITGGVNVLEIRDKKKPEIWKKLFSLSSGDFKKFIPLFDIIDVLFNHKDEK